MCYCRPQRATVLECVMMPPLQVLQSHCVEMPESSCARERSIRRPPCGLIGHLNLQSQARPSAWLGAERSHALSVHLPSLPASQMQADTVSAVALAAVSHLSTLAAIDQRHILKGGRLYMPGCQKQTAQEHCYKKSAPPPSRW